MKTTILLLLGCCIAIFARSVTAFATLGRRNTCIRQRLKPVHMVKYRGLEVKRESPTPTAEGMTLYVKAAQDGKSLGDCPFAHFVRLVLHEKGFIDENNVNDDDDTKSYELRPAVEDSKPSWLVEHYEGKMPALRHGKECYVESDVIADYLDFFFPEPPLKVDNDAEARQAIDGFFPAVAKYLKNTSEENDAGLLQKLKDALSKLEQHLDSNGGPYLCGNTFTILDCGLAPKLYHMQVGLEAFKDQSDMVGNEYPKVKAYMDTVFARESFKQTVYDKSIVEWGWSNARK